MAKIGYLSGVSSVISNLSDVVIFDLPANLETATIADYSTSYSVTDVIEDTIAYSGDTASYDTVNNIKGASVTSTRTAGSIEFDFFVADTGLNASNVFAGASVITPPSTAPDWIGGTATIYGASGDVERQKGVGFINSQLNKMLFLPNSTISAEWGEESGIWGWSVHVVANSVNTANLKTWMVINIATGEFEYDDSIIATPTSAPLIGGASVPYTEKTLVNPSTKSTKSEL